MIVELRQYTHHPGRRDDLIALFEQKFIDGHAAVGMPVIASFRDANDPDRFVWLRGFANMEARTESLQAFYGGTLWKANRDAANSTLLDSDDVLLLHPARPGSGFMPDVARGGVIAAMVYPSEESSSQPFIEVFERTIEPALVGAGSTVLAAFSTEHAVNTFPNLPFREGEDVFVWFARFVDFDAFERFRVASKTLRLPQPIEVMVLIPTTRSPLR
jgi:hypothetical protein